MAADDTTIRIKTTADVSGAVQTQREFDRVSAKAREMGKANADAAAKSTSAINGIQGAIGKVHAALSGFGLVGIVMQIASVFKAMRAEADDTAAAIEKAKAESLARSLKEARKEFEEVKRLASEFAERMADADKVQQGILANTRGMRDANLSLAEAREIASIGNDDRDRDLKIRQINQRYAAMRGGNSAMDQLEDIRLKRQRNAEMMSGNSGRIAELEAQSSDLLAEESSLRKSAQDFGSKANGILTRRNWMGLAGRNWAGLSNGEDALKAANKSLELSGNADAVSDERKAIEEHIRQLKRANAALAAENEALEGQRDVVATRRAAEKVAEDTSARDVAQAIGSRASKRDKAAAERERLTASVTSGESMSANLRRQIAFHQSRYGAAVDTQARAGLDESIARGDKSAADNSGLKAAQEAKYQADRTVAQIAATINELTAKLKAVEAGLKRDRSRLASAKEEL